MKFLLLTCALIAAVAADVSHLPTNQYLPPHHAAASVPEVAYAAPAASSVSFQSAPAPVSFQSAPAFEAAPAASFQSFQGAASAPAPAFHATSFESAPAASFGSGTSFGGAEGAVGAVGGSSFDFAASAPAAAYHAPSAPVFQPAASVGVAAVEAAPAHSFSANDGYRYKTQRRVVYRQRRRRRDVSHLSNDYLPPFQGAGSVSVPTQDYLPPQSIGAASNFVQDFSPAESGAEYETAGSEAGHSFSADSGYRYRTNRRRVYRRHRY